MLSSLPAMARAESLVAKGTRDGDLAIGDDLASAVDVLGRLREQGAKDSYQRVVRRRKLPAPT